MFYKSGQINVKALPESIYIHPIYTKKLPEDAKMLRINAIELHHFNKVLRIYA